MLQKNHEKLNFRIFVKDLPRLTRRRKRYKFAARSISQPCVKDHAIKSAKMVFVTIIFLQPMLQISLSENGSLDLALPSLRFAKFE